MITLQKPFSPEKMELVLRKAAEYRKIQMVHNETDKDEPVKYFLPDIIGKSKAIQDVAKRVVKVAPSDCQCFDFWGIRNRKRTDCKKHSQ